MKERAFLASVLFTLVFLAPSTSCPAQSHLLAESPEITPSTQTQANYAEAEKEVIGKALEDIAPQTEESFEEKYKDEKCIFLLHETSIEVNEDFSYTTKIHKKVKILKESAKWLGEISVYYEKGRERITHLEAFTITPEGEKLRYSRIQDRNSYDGYRMYSDQRYKLITMPEVNVGATLEYEATRVSKGKAVKGAFWYDFSLDSTIPIKEKIVRISFPKSVPIHYKKFNLKHEPEITETETTVTYLWRLHEVSPYKSSTKSFRPPPTVDSITNYVEFCSMESWKDISDWYYSLVEKNMKITYKIKKATKKAIGDKKTVREKTRAILEYVQKSFRYVSMSFGDNTLEPHATNKIFRNKYGDCKDLSLLCKAMLEVAGVKSHMALFNTEFTITDPQEDLPIPSFFDHVLLLVEDPEEGNFYADPLLDGYDIGEYPMSYQRAYTFIINKTGGKFGRFPVFDEERQSSNLKRTIAILPDGSCWVEAKSEWSLDSSIKTRAIVQKLNGEKKEKFFEGLDERYDEVEERRWEGIDEKYGRIKSYLRYKQKDVFVSSGDVIVIAVKGVEELKGSLVEEERKDPVFSSENYLKKRETTYRLPQGYRVSHIPKDFNFDIGFYGRKREYLVTPDSVTIKEVTRWKRMALPKEDYEKVTAFCEKLPKETNQRMVFKKIKPWWQEIKDILMRFKK